MTDEQRERCMGEGGAACCALLVMGRQGFECSLGGPLEELLVERVAAGQMHARWLPDAVPCERTVVVDDGARVEER